MMTTRKQRRTREQVDPNGITVTAAIMFPDSIKELADSIDRWRAAFERSGSSP